MRPPGGAFLAVIFDSKSSLGLVRTRVRNKLDELTGLVSQDGGGVPPHGLGGAGSAPPVAQAVVSVRDLDDNKAE